jgi:gamma-glutamyltranspeptidase/glutathione hydrolase
MTLVYYEAKTATVISLDAGYNSYRNETEPSTIPASETGPLNQTFHALRAREAPGATTSTASSKGRETLVPGFMAGIEAMHSRFGRLPFADLFEPAIWYAERGLIVNLPMSGCFTLRRDFPARTPEGRQFLRQAGNDMPHFGDRFHRPELAKTLRAVAKQGSQYMYKGLWGQDFVKTIQREGG